MSSRSLLSPVCGFHLVRFCGRLGGVLAVFLCSWGPFVLVSPFVDDLFGVGMQIFLAAVLFSPNGCVAVITPGRLEGYF